MLQHRNKAGRLWLALLFLMALLVGAWPGIVTAQGALLSIEPRQSQADPGADLRVEVVIADVENLGFFQFDLTFDPAVVQVRTVTLGGFLASTGRAANGVGPIIDNDQGTLTFGGYSVGEQAGPNGTGVLAQVTIRGVDNGVSPLNLSNFRVLSANNISIAAAAASRATVTIGVPPTPTPAAQPPAMPAPNTVQPATTAPTATMPASQATATAMATATPTVAAGSILSTPTLEAAPATSAPGVMTPVPAIVTLAPASPAGATDPTATVEASAAAPTALVETPEPAAAVASPTIRSVDTAETLAPSSTPVTTAVAVAPRSSNEMGASERTSSSAPRSLLGLGAGAMVLAGIIALAILILVLAQRRGS